MANGNGMKLTNDNIRTILMVVSFVATIVFAYSSMQSKYDLLCERLEAQKQKIEKYELRFDIQDDKLKKIDEIYYNVQNICEKLGVTYKQ